jgi:hypothetical protein
MLQTTEIEVADIISNKAMLMRVKVDGKTVRQYAKAMEGGAVFPPIVCFEVAGELILTDGFHRVEAYKSLGVEKVNADVRIGTMDDAILAAVRANAHEGLARSNADKEKTVRALLSSGWAGNSENWIAQTASVHHSVVKRIKKDVESGSRARTSNETNAPIYEGRVGKDGKRYPAKRAKPTSLPLPAAPVAAAPAKPAVAAAPAPTSISKPPPLPQFTPEQLGAPPPELAKEQDPDSPPGVTRAQAWTQKYGHVHLRPLDERQRAEQEKKVTSFIAALRELEKPADALMKHALDPDQFLATLRDIKGSAMAAKFKDRMAAIEPLVTHLNALMSTAQRAGKNAA